MKFKKIIDTQCTYDIIPTSANKFGTHAQIACAGHGLTISGPSRSKCIHPLRNQYTTALSERKIDSKFSTHWWKHREKKKNRDQKREKIKIKETRENVVRLKTILRNNNEQLFQKKVHVPIRNNLD